MIVQLVALAGLSASLTPPGERYDVSPDTGNNGFSAVFDAPLGERINAVSSSLRCELRVDDAAHGATGHCDVPLTSIKVDNEPTKTEHFEQWATNKKMEPEKCQIEVALEQVTLAGPLVASTAVPFTAAGRFRVCGRSREPAGTEPITGTVVLFPPGAYGAAKTLRIRAHVEGFDRESYGVSPKATAGWLARVQQLAPVVAAKGNIDVSIFAKVAH
ncbi:MAG: hypothetical protein ACYCWW_12705 [Deltaproteobacteria bacterium]